ncbi:dsDNA nuclease domain-containing protein [Sphingomonas sp.]|jgi:hypothetical protein|uniref:dsDNA nuclease domain-containing protein n=1 Tax=Sphingomonas sp. TaxID=28214 RepID=UPI002E36BD40|nr:dsDNA nuclease domain-containing protein [Sphingomonas sp.]HEX4693359.1 dsDNA nuclease domain-containing protein [Sphingomonas sp.]
MGDLFTDLTKKPQRETAGSDASSRFDYQKDWAFCEMMLRHRAQEDYLVAFEFHDDVLFLSPADQPTSAEFYQVKTSSGASPRTLSSLTSQPKGKASILGKMFSNFDGVCASHDIRVVIVSNNAFEFAGTAISADALDQKFRDRLLEKMQSEIPGFDASRLAKLHFRITGVSLDAMQSFLEGEAMELFCQKYGDDHGLNIRTWIRLIKGEIARRNNYPSDKISTPADLVDKKCIDFPFVEKTLDVMHARTKRPIDVTAVISEMSSKGWSSIDVMRFQKRIPEASIDFYNPVNQEVVSIVSLMRCEVNDLTGSPVELTDFMTDVVEKIMKDGSVGSIYKQTDYLRALGALVYYDEV